ncbi:MAG: thioredoxin [Candidatus Omnitrophota bacterium]|nr:thioredoxin [Candidatus Omnitrophota bacterium]MBU1928838.1 thioredoxin [Candidatus Omnitrophota bacterium]MBU2034448.1 thioredoxin [Candidatus Omnitrophota bacterium]
MFLLHLNEGNFKKEVLEAKTLVVVDFWAAWCGPCKMIAPIIEELANEYAQKIKIAKVDIDDNSDIATQYGIMSIPTLMFFKNGKVAAQAVGAISKAELKRKIEENF